MKRTGTIPVKVWNPAPKKRVAKRKKKEATTMAKRKKKRAKKKTTTRRNPPRKRTKRRRARAASAAPKRRHHRRARRANPAPKRRRTHRRRRNPGIPWEAIGAIALGAGAFAVGKAIPSFIPSANFDATHRMYTEVGVSALGAAALVGGIMAGHPLLGVGAGAGFVTAGAGDAISAKVQAMFSGMPAPAAPVAAKIGDPVRIAMRGDGSAQRLLSGRGLDDDNSGHLEGIIMQGIREDIGGIDFGG